jgi:hypothetical protein
MDIIFSINLLLSSAVLTRIEFAAILELRKVLAAIIPELRKNFRLFIILLFLKERKKKTSSA